MMEALPIASQAKAIASEETKSGFVAGRRTETGAVIVNCVEKPIYERVASSDMSPQFMMD